MIKFKNSEQELILKIERYQFPTATEYYDANWLIVNIAIKSNYIKAFNKSDPCLLTTELVELKEWFQEILKEKGGKLYTINFMEPYLAFECQHNTVEISLEYHLNPMYDKDCDAVYKVKFHLNEKDITMIISKLEEYIKKFPIKNFIND